MNRVCLAGRLAADPELRDTSGDVAIAKMRVAVDEYVKGEKRSYFFNVTAFGAQAETCVKHLAKGSSVAVDGRLRTRTWEKEDGSKGFDVEVVADRVDFMGSKSDAKPEPQGEEPAPW